MDRDYWEIDHPINKMNLNIQATILNNALLQLPFKL